MTSVSFDPIELTIFGNLMAAIVEEACGTVERTAFTTFVKESNDYCVALADLEGNFIAYPRKSGVTTFIGLPLDKVLHSIEDWAPGDLVITNDPYSTAGLVTHAPDINLISPIFVRGKPAAFCWGFLHSSDVGGSTPGSIAPSNHDIYQEGLRIPPTKLYRANELNEDLLKLIRTNVRTPVQVWGDLRALMSAFHVADLRVQELFSKYGLDASQRLIQQCLDYTEAKARSVVARLNPGVYRFHDYLDDDVGTEFPVRICLTLTVSDSDLVLDFTGTDPQVLAAFNLATSGRKSHAWLTIGVVHFLLTEDPEILLNGGILRPISVNAPPGTIVHAVSPAAVGGRIVTGIRVMDVTFGALAQAAPGIVPAAGAGQGMLPVIAIPSAEPGGRKVNVLQPLVGGSGGRPTSDGYDGTDYSFGFLKNTPIEVLESEMEVHVHRYGFVRDSGGPGKYRGGLGVHLTVEALLPDTSISMRGMERTRFAPWGLRGGLCGASTAPATVNKGAKNQQIVRRIDVLQLNAGDVLELTSSGGGGYGSPLERELTLIERDVAFGYVSVDAAREHYGAVFVNGAVDSERSNSLRATRKAVACSDSLYSYGKARLEYEARWTPEAYEALAELYPQLPMRLRPLAKRLIMQQLKENAAACTTRSISRSDVLKAWKATGGRLGSNSGSNKPLDPQSI